MNVIRNKVDGECILQSNPGENCETVKSTLIRVMEVKVMDQTPLKTLDGIYEGEQARSLKGLKRIQQVPRCALMCAKNYNAA